VTSSVAVFEAVAWVKSMYMTKSWFKTWKRRKYGNFYTNFHLLDGIVMEFLAC